MTVVHADCLLALQGLADHSVTAIITDPPYGLEFMGKGWDKVLPPTAIWREALRVLRPGGHALVFGGTRTYHRLAVSLEDAGFEIRDCLMWLTGQGFPKSHSVEKALHEKAEQAAQRDVRFVRDTYLSTSVYACRECGQVLFESVPEPSVSVEGPASLGSSVWRGQSSVEGRSNLQARQGELRGCPACTLSHGVFCDGAEGRLRGGAPARDGEEARALSDFFGGSPSQGPQPVEQRPGEPDAVFLERRAQAFRGFGTALKPAWEPIILARKPLVGTVAANCQEHGTGALNIDGCRIGPGHENGRGREGEASSDARYTERGGTNIAAKPGPRGGDPAGRWPANLVLDDSAAELLDEQAPDKGQAAPLKTRHADKLGRNAYGEMKGTEDANFAPHEAPGGASRFFYCAKASKRDRGAKDLITWENADLSSDLADMRELARATCESGALRMEDRSCSTDSSGRPLTDLCPTDTRSIIAMASRTITALRTSSSRPISSTRDIIRDAIGTIWVAGSSPAELAALTRTSSLASTDAGTASALSAASALFDALSKISEKGKRGNVHSTVKPVELMRWLVRLVKGPADNLILDPFAGSGSTGVAAQLESVPFLLIEREAEYVEIIKARLGR